MTNSEKIIELLEMAKRLAEAEFKSQVEFTYKLKHPNHKDQQFKEDLNQILDE